jgi:hypothetical protein
MAQTGDARRQACRMRAECAELSPKAIRLDVENEFGRRPLVAKACIRFDRNAVVAAVDLHDQNLRSESINDLSVHEEVPTRIFAMR